MVGGAQDGARTDGDLFADADEPARGVRGHAGAERRVLAHLQRPALGVELAAPAYAHAVRKAHVVAALHGEAALDEVIEASPAAAAKPTRKAPAKPVAAFDVAKACNAIRTAETRAKAEHYADVAFERATNDQQRKQINDALQSYEVAA